MPPPTAFLLSHVELLHMSLNKKKKKDNRTILLVVDNCGLKGGLKLRCDKLETNRKTHAWYIWNMRMCD